MSSFLLNLARRGAGLAPIVRSRAAGPPVSLPPGGAEPTADAGLRPMAAPAASPASPVEAHVIPPAPPVPAQAAAAPSTSAAAPLVQRMPALAAAPAPIVSGPGRPIAPAEPPSVPASPARPAFEPRAIEAASVPRAPAAAVAPQAPRADVPPIADVSITARPGPPAPSAEPDRELPVARAAVISRIVEVVREERPIAVPSAGQAPRDTNQALARFEPAPVRTTPRAPAEPAREQEPRREVHVRIGAIEIHAAPPEAIAASAPLPTPPPAEVSGGFDDFTPLRSYATWSW